MILTNLPKSFLYLLFQVRNIAEQERATPKRIPFYASEFIKHMNLQHKSEIVEKILVSLKALKDSDVELEVEIKSNNQSRRPICPGGVVIDSFLEPKRKLTILRVSFSVALLLKVSSNTPQQSTKMAAFSPLELRTTITNLSEAWDLVFTLEAIISIRST